MIVDRPTAAFVCIGDEILCGSTQDVNLAYLGDWLNRHGVALKEARVIADDTQSIQQAVLAMHRSYDYVFTSGGIGSTHDDITAESIADAFQLSLIEDPDALAMLEQNYAGKGGVNNARRRMARVPAGATLISGEGISAPGFQVHNVMVLAGVPSIFRAMLNASSQRITGGDVWLSRALMVMCGETQIAERLTEVQQAHDGVQIGSYPKHNEIDGYHTKLVFRSPDTETIDAAVAAMQAHLASQSLPCQDLGYGSAG